MIIDIIPYASTIRPDLIKNRTVVVIDVLRASSVMVTALAHGASAFIPAASVKEALRLASEIPATRRLLGGERDTRIIPGFDLGNSPLDYTEEKVKDKTVILATSNGTKALNALHDARKILIGSFLNLEALAEKLTAQEEVVLVCSGTNNNFSMDDALCASRIMDKISAKKAVRLSDMALTLRMAFQEKNRTSRELLRDCYHLNLLIRNGFEKDVDYCLQENMFDLVPEMQEGRIRIPEALTTS